MYQQIFDIKLLLTEYKEIFDEKQQQNPTMIQNFEKIQQVLNKIRFVHQNDNKKKIESRNLMQIFHFSLNSGPQNIDIHQESKDESQDYSDTLSLSFNNEQQQSFDFKNYQDWQVVLEIYGDFFRPVSYFKSYIRVNKFDNIVNNIKSFEVIQKETKLYSGFNLEQNDWIVLREQDIGNKSILESIQQYIIHDHIYKLYPNKFLKLILPIYVETHKFDKNKFISQIEFGQINLYDYSLENQIEDIEFEHIFQQIYEQIKLLHKHKIAHRDIKPQNIVYVENKGWLLCDFGDSIQYENAIGIYSIKGTYAFLQPYLQHKSKIQGISIKQNLLENDIYALAITMIIIKYQIRNQVDISQYLFKNDNKIINTLIKTPTIEHIDSIINKCDQVFIKPQIKQQSQIQILQEIDIEEFIGYITILQNQALLVKLTEEVKIRIIELINYKLSLKNEYYNFINILCYVRIPNYLKQLKNLISFQQLRQPKYWRNLLREVDISKNIYFVINQIKFMDALGLTDITYQHAKLFLQNNYDFSIHIILIKLLNFFKQEDQAQYELQQIFIYRQFKQMTYEQLTQLVELALNNFSWDMFCEEDIKQFQQLKVEGIYMNMLDIIQKDLSDQDFIIHSIEAFNQLTFREDKQLSIGSIFYYIEQVIEFKNIFTSLELIQQLKQHNLKYFCTTFHWQNLIKYQIVMHQFLGDKKRVKELTKQMNYIMIYNSESSSQQLILRMIKLNAFSSCRITNIKQKRNPFEKLNGVVNNYNNLSFQFYKNILFNELMCIIYNISQHLISKDVLIETLLKYFKILIQLLKSMNFIRLFNDEEQALFFRIIFYLYFRTLNKKRYCKLLINKNIQIYLIGGGLKTEFMSFDNKILLKQRKYQHLVKIYIKQQYIERY